MANEERLKSLLSDLGKATLRGVRKCPKCGTYNGSRGHCCKNKFCDAVFKEPGEKRKLSTEACKLITGSTAQIFSVRARDKDPDYRDFVQLPLIGGSTSNEIIHLITLSTSLCFVDGCERNFNTTFLKNQGEKTLEKPVSNCQHIQAALRCYAEAQPLTLRNSVLLSLNVNNELKQEIWLLATETSGPLVQRVSKHTMVVKCKATSKHPLGYLHFSFFMTKLKDKIEHRFLCSCTPSKVPKSMTDKTDLSQSCQSVRCIHFYACICAFASEEKLTEEFEYYINLDHSNSSVPRPLGSNLRNNEGEKFINMDVEGLNEDTHLLVFRDDVFTVQNLDGDLGYVNLDTNILPESIVDNVKVYEQNFLNDTGVISQVHNLEVIDQNAGFGGSTVKIISNQAILDKLNNSNQCIVDDTLKIINTNNVKFLDTNVVLNGNNIRLLGGNSIADSGMKIVDKNLIVECNNEIPKSNPRIINSAKRKRDEKQVVNINSAVDINSLKSIDPGKVKNKTTNAKKFQCSNIPVDESTANQTFINWLASITERINQTMHFQFNGKPDPLIFHVPKIFFECLRERISCGGKKKRLPNSTTAFIRKDGVPLGTFTKYSWQITNILHVKSIFETSLIPLEITRSFIQNADGTYELYKRQETDIDRYKKTTNSALIKPMELKTFLKVGNTSPSQVEPTPFLIEWIPDILPISKIGELRLKFEFGHVKNETPQSLRKESLLRKSIN